MNHRTEGIVLSSINYGEADLVVTFLTDDYGIIKAFAKSPRKIRSRFGSSLEPLTRSKISFWGSDEGKLPRLTQADILNSFSSIKESFHSFLKVSELIEMTLHFVPERDPSKHVYSLFVSVLHHLETDCNVELVMLYYKLKLLSIAGYLPGIDSCGRCGRKGDLFHLAHGTVLCENCSKGTEMSCRLSLGVRSFFSNLLSWEISKLNRLKPGENILGELTMLLDEHTKYISEKVFRTRMFKNSQLS